MEYVEKTGRIEVPKNAGIRGFLKTIESILKLTRVQSIEIDARGHVDYVYAVREGENPKELEITFESLMPLGVVRNGKVEEMPLVDPGASAGDVMGVLLDRVETDRLYPVALVTGANTRLWNWYERTAARPWTNHESFFGIPVLLDQQVEDTTLILCAAYTRRAEFIDTQRSYKVNIPEAR